MEKGRKKYVGSIILTYFHSMILDKFYWGRASEYWEWGILGGKVLVEVYIKNGCISDALLDKYI
ncbi:hypothetical protein [Methanosarcina barkeri]|uniref:hypothetical protein n=1 Tax=Methanosarcina barkeri TaxID=2208 RepID=UPI0006CF719C|nr:hypothetical protein [Methanosarcina barkeri]